MVQIWMAEWQVSASPWHFAVGEDVELLLGVVVPEELPFVPTTDLDLSVLADQCRARVVDNNRGITAYAVSLAADSPYEFLSEAPPELVGSGPRVLVEDHYLLTDQAATCHVTCGRVLDIQECHVETVSVHSVHEHPAPWRRLTSVPEISGERRYHRGGTLTGWVVTLEPVGTREKASSAIARTPYRAGLPDTRVEPPPPEIAAGQTFYPRSRLLDRFLGSAADPSPTSGATSRVGRNIATTSTMHALVRDRYGSPDVLRVAEVPQPTMAENEVLVRIRAASVNQWDYHLLLGRPPSRWEAPRRPKHRILGCDIAGEVEAVGRRVSRFRPGDAVIADLSASGFGAFAEYASVPEQDLTGMPTSLSFADAAAVPQAGGLALQALRHGHGMRPGDRVLVVGAGGGAGTFAVQLARALGAASVTAVDRGAKLDGLRDLGAASGVDFEREDFATQAQRYDLVVDLEAHRRARDYARVIAPGGSRVIVGGSLTRIAGALVAGAARGVTRHQRTALLAYRANDPDVMTELCGHLEAGRAHPVVERCYPLAEAPEALRRVGDGLAFGKVVVTM